MFSLEKADQIYFQTHLTLTFNTFFYAFKGALADLCQLDNGGCSQVCYNLCNLKVKCSCWPGYTLAYDGKTCMGKI